MLKVIFVVLFAIFIIWSVVGMIYFIKINSYIRNKLKLLILALLCGPIVWISLFFEYMFKFIDGLVADKFFKKFEDWLIK